MIDILDSLKENDNKIIVDYVNDNELSLLKQIGVSEKDTLMTTQSKIHHYLCQKHHKGALFMIDEDKYTKADKELLKIDEKINKDIFKIII